MSKIFHCKLFISCFLAIFLTPCFLYGAAFRLIVTTDTHSSWRSSGEYNWLKMAAGIRETIAADELPHIKIDCGDTISGSREAAESGYTLGIHAMNELAFDVWIPGNHDFDAGKEHFAAMVSLFNGQVICANTENKGIKPYTIINCGGFKIAVIGLLTKAAENFFVLPEQKPDVAGEKESVDKAMEMLRNSGKDFDFVILAMHRGIYTKGEKVDTLLQGNNEIKLVLGGHSHIVSQAEPVRNSAFSAAGHGAKGFMEIIISAEDDKKTNPDMVFYYHESSQYDADENFADAVESNWTPLSANELAHPIGKFSQIPASGQKRTRTSTLASVYLQAMLFDEDNDTAAMTVATTRRKVKFPQEITPQVLFDLVPHYDHVLVYQLTGEELKAIIAEQFAISKKKPQTPVCMNIKVECDAEGNILKILPEQESYKVAFTDFLAAGSGGRNPVIAGILKDKQYLQRGTLREKLEALLRSKDTVELKRQPWVIIQKPLRDGSK